MRSVVRSFCLTTSIILLLAFGERWISALLMVLCCTFAQNSYCRADACWSLEQVDIDGLAFAILRRDISLRWKSVNDSKIRGRLRLLPAVNHSSDIDTMFSQIGALT